MTSICVPTYNGSKHLAECIASIRSQTRTDFEVIICDDESSDGTLDLARRLADGDKRFRFISNPRRLGLVGNWNNCLDKAQGDWIKFVFQDDLLAPNCLERLVAGCERLKCPFGFCQREILFDASVDTSTRNLFQEHQETIAKLYSGRDYIEAAAFARMCADRPGANLIGEPTVVLFNRSVFSDFGGLNPALVQLCDMEYWARVGANVGVVHVPEKLATFRVHGGSATAQNQSGREFHKSKLDPLILRYLFLQHSQCRRIRTALYERPGRLTAWWQCLRAAYIAWRVARPNLFHSDGADAKIRNDWQAAVRTYPGLQRLAWAGLWLMPVWALARFFKRS